MTPALHTDADLDEVSHGMGLRGAAAGAAAAGRFEGSVRRESDGATFLRAIELGTPSGTSQSIRCYEQLGGGLPTTPQHSGTATAARRLAGSRSGRGGPRSSAGCRSERHEGGETTAHHR